MKQIISISLFATMALWTGSMSAEAPSVMLLPDKTWCNSNGYVNRIDVGGKTRVIENYEEAFLNEELTQIKTGVNSIFSQRGFPLKDYLAQTEGDDEDEMEEEAFESAETGSSLASNAHDQIMNKAKPDILLKIGWIINQVGFNYSISYRLEAVDSYSNKSIAAVTGEGEPVGRQTPLTASIGESMRSNMDEFCSQLMNHFADIQANGREMRMNFRIIDNGSGVNFNTEYGGKELGSIIYDWMHENTQAHRFNERTATRNRRAYDQVRVPMRDASGKAMNARQFVDRLRKHLSALGICAENTSSRLGTGGLVIGEK